MHRADPGEVATVSSPASDVRADGAEPSQPAAATEQAIGAIWCEVLGLAEVGSQDNFFGLGGNSLNAMQAVARIRRALECPQLKLADVFRAATLRDLAERVEALSCAERP